MESVPIFLKLIPPALRNTVEQNINGNWVPNGPYKVDENGRLTRQNNTTRTANLQLEGTQLGIQPSSKADRFERITGVRLAVNTGLPVWLTHRSTTADTVSNSQWLRKQLAQYGINPNRLDSASLTNPERWNLQAQLRRTITDVFDGFFSNNNQS
jgi:hypothetical protein